MSKTIGINGLGRIGRMLVRLNEISPHPKLKIKAINSRADLETAAHLLQYDSVHGRFPQKVSVQNNMLCAGNQQIHYTSFPRPQDIPWQKWGVDVVLECSGVFKTRSCLQGHLNQGAKKVLIAYPAPAADEVVIYGLNHTKYNPRHSLISFASCTTNCLAPLIQVLDKAFKVEALMFTTVHSYTLDQKLLDSAHKDLRRARAGGLSIIPTGTGAAAALTPLFPHLKNKITGLAVRVPTPNVSLVDAVFRLKNQPSQKAIKQTLLSSAQGSLKGVLYCESAPLVSADFCGSTFSCIVDMPSVSVLEDGMVKILAWYDNETGFSQRMLNFIHTCL